MNVIKIIAIVFIAVGTLGLVYGSFSYTTTTHEATVGSLELSLDEKKRVNVPIWAGVGSIVIGGVLMLLPRKD